MVCHSPSRSGTTANEIENPRCAEQSADKLAKLQRKLARAVRGSNNYKSLKDKIAKLHKRINPQGKRAQASIFRPRHPVAILSPELHKSSRMDRLRWALARLPA